VTKIKPKVTKQGG